MIARRESGSLDILIFEFHECKPAAERAPFWRLSSTVEYDTCNLSYR